MIKPGKTWQRIKRPDFLCLLEWLCRLKANEMTDPEHILTNSSTSPSILGFLNGLNNPWQAARLSYYKWWSMYSQWQRMKSVRNVNSSTRYSKLTPRKYLDDIWKSKCFWFQKFGHLMKKINEGRCFSELKFFWKTQTLWKFSRKL